MIALAVVGVLFLCWAILHVEARLGWHEDEVEAERFLAALREDEAGR